MISALEAKRLLHKGCETYLAHVINKSSSEVTLDNVLIVCEFSENLLGLSLNRELEFGIELLLGSAPVSIPPYRMTPVELKKIKDPIAGFGGQEIYPTKCISVGCTGIICKKERRNHAIVYRLPAT